MGIYSNDTATLGYSASLDNIEEAVGYDQDEVSCQIAMCESFENELSLFQATIRSDIHATSMVNEGYGEDEVLAFSEGVVGNVIEKIKEFFKKLWAKIKAIFHNFIAKFDSVFMKSNKEFVNKYAKDVYGKTYTDFSVKWSEPDLKNMPKMTAQIVNIDPGYNVKQSDLDSLLSNFDASDEFESTVDVCFNNLGKVSESEFEKEFMDKCFKDEEDDDKIGSKIHGIGQALLGMKEEKKSLNDFYTSAEKAISKIITDLSKSQTTMSKAFPGDEKKTSPMSGRIKEFDIKNKDGKISYEKKEEGEKSLSHSEGEKWQKATRLASMYASVFQKVINKASGCSIKALKKANSEYRRVWAKAVAYSGKKEDAIMNEAFIELAEYEADCVYEA